MLRAPLVKVLYCEMRTLLFSGEQIFPQELQVQDEACKEAEHGDELMSTGRAPSAPQRSPGRKHALICAENPNGTLPSGASYGVSAECGLPGCKQSAAPQAIAQAVGIGLPLLLS